MGLWRNKEFRFVILIMISVTAAATVASLFLYPGAALLVASLGILLILLEYLFSRARYRKIARLSEYLKSVNDGNYSLEIKEYEEGELSILKSEIYKSTMTLCVQAEELKKEKSQLADAMSDISHQLKTPLTSMLVMTDLLCDSDLPTQKRIEFTEHIKGQLHRIEWLVTSLLKLSRIDASSVSFHRQNVPMGQLINKALKPLQIPIELRAQTVEIHTCNQPILCDMNWTTEALLNILKNCVEHTPIGGKLRIDCTGNALFAQITVSDNGSGIDPKDLPHIFERFYRGKNSGEDSVGIGLAMARSIITSQGGSVSCESELGRGTMFTIKFFG